MRRVRTSNRWGTALHGFWFGFGEDDGYAILEAPDNVSAAGAVIAIAAGGALASVETTVLISRSPVGSRACASSVPGTGGRGFETLTPRETESLGYAVTEVVASRATCRACGCS
jgi:GYD domain-containing protein